MSEEEAVLDVLCDACQILFIEDPNTRTTVRMEGDKQYIMHHWPCELLEAAKHGCHLCIMLLHPYVLRGDVRIQSGGSDAREPAVMDEWWEEILKFDSPIWMRFGKRDKKGFGSVSLKATLKRFDNQNSTCSFGAVTLWDCNSKLLRPLVAWTASYNIQ